MVFFYTRFVQFTVIYQISKLIQNRALNWFFTLYENNDIL